MQFLSFLQNSALSLFLQDASWVFYGLLGLHSLGMAAVVGTSIMLSLRVLGVGIGAPISDFERLRTLAGWGFLINLGSGVLIFVTNATQLTFLWTFQLKMACIAIGGLMLWLLWRRIAPYRTESGHHFDNAAKMVAAATIFFWVSAIVSGRYIAYTLPQG